MFTGAFPFCWKDDEPDLQVHCPITFHARIQKVLSEGVQLWQVFLGGEGGSKCPYKQAIIGPPARRILNGVLLADRWWPNIECWLGSFGIFIGSGPILLENPVFFVIFRRGGGGGVRTPCPHSGSAHALHLHVSINALLESLSVRLSISIKMLFECLSTVCINIMPDFCRIWAGSNLFAKTALAR